MMNHNMQMQKETGKILHRKFLSENIGLLLMAPVFLLLMFIVSNLYQLPAEYAFYLTSIFLILWVTTLCMQYRGFRKRTEQYEKESKEKQESNSKESRQWEELQEKKDFFALWAHQIKTPIAALNLLLQGEKQDVAACRQELFKIESYVEMALNYLRFEEMSNDRSTCSSPHAIHEICCSSRYCRYSLVTFLLVRIRYGLLMPEASGQRSFPFESTTTS